MSLRKKKKEKNIFILFLIVSAWLHFLMLLVVISYSFQKKSVQEKNRLLKIIKPKFELPASLKPRKSNFGTFIFYDQPPKEIPKQLPKQITPKKKELVKKRPIKPKKKIKKKSEKRTPKIIKKAKPIKQKKGEPTKLIKLAQTKSQKKRKKNEFIQKKTIKQDKKIAKKIKAIEKKQQQLAQLQKSSADHKIKKTKKRKRNIIAMTRGFIENSTHKGNDWLERKGDDKKRPSFEELKYLSYEQRINWQLQASWKRHCAHHPNIHSLGGKATISFAIDQHGNLSNLELLQSSGQQKLDELIIETTRKASPFPPLPKHFKTTMYSTGKIIHVHSKAFGF